MKTLVFKGHINTGVGRHVELGIPGRTDLPEAAHDWPDKLQPGSLNVRVNQDGYPPEVLACSPFHGVAILDNGPFPPAFLISQSKMSNNKLMPRPNIPQRGTAQVWRAHLWVSHISGAYPAWVFRRIGSRVGEQLELVSDVYLRKTLSLTDGMEAIVELEYDEK